MDMIGCKVRHKSLGDGTVQKQEGKYLFVQFSAGAPLKMIYPDSFKVFLQCLDVSKQQQISKDLAAQETIQQAQETQQHNRDHSGVDQTRNRSNTSNRNRPSHNKAVTVAVPEIRSVADFCEIYQATLAKEVYFLKSKGGKKYKATDGKLIEFRSGKYVYSFETDTELALPDNTGITIFVGIDKYVGSVIGCDEFIVYIASSVFLGDAPSVVEFTAEHWRLIHNLSERLGMLQFNPSPIVQAFVCDGQKNIDYKNSNMITGQENAIRMSSNQPITFVWGPPGTGKTETLARIAQSHMCRGKRVLMLSYSNVSVDGAIIRTFHKEAKHQAGRFVRYGYPKDEMLLQHEYLSSYNLAIHQHPDLLKRRTLLIEEQRTLSKTCSRYLDIRQQLSSIRDKLMDEEKRSVRLANFVATTVTKAIADKTIYEQKFDVVIFDEASMAYIPQIVFAASLAKQHFICMGDFKQLPPIVQSDKQSVLNTDIFQYCGIAKAVEARCNHKWLCLLNTQYRMHPEIAQFASETMYKNLLISAEDMKENRREIVENKPHRNFPIGMIDLSGTMSVCTQTIDQSRINPLSAFVAFAYALQGSAKNDVGIITPYNAQSRLIHAMTRDGENFHPQGRKIMCATVHQFQGSEKDVIIYDAVDCYRMPFPGTLITSLANDYANRLFNVAITRAKGKFIALANINYMEKKKLSRQLVFQKLIETHRYKKSCTDASAICVDKPNISEGPLSFYKAETAQAQFIEDLNSAQKEIRIDIPGSLLKNDVCLQQILSVLLKKQQAGLTIVIRAEHKGDLSSGFKKLAIENQYVANPITIIDKKIVWFGEPLSDAHFKVEGTTIQTNYRPIIRFQGAHTAKSLYNFLEMNKTVDQYQGVLSEGETETTFAQYVRNYETCPNCGSSMMLKKSRKGKFFLSCSKYPKCEEVKWIEPELVNDYLYSDERSGKKCKKCPCSLTAEIGQYGLYIHCEGIHRHTYKLDEI